MKKYALTVGVSTYTDPEITDLPFAARDAVEVAHCLQESSGFDDVRTLATGTGREPDHVSIVDALHSIAQLLTHDDLFLFYFAGHGIETTTGAHLLTANSRIRMPQIASISSDVLGDCLSQIECADRVLILDACRNDPHKGRGDQDNRLTTGFSRDIIAVAETPIEGVIPTTCVLFSCRPGERAYEWPDKQHGVFSHYLLEGLRGAAVDDSGHLTVQALGNYVENQVPKWAKKARTPQMQTPWGEQKGSWRDVVLSSAAGAAPKRKSASSSSQTKKQSSSARSSPPNRPAQQAAPKSLELDCSDGVMMKLLLIPAGEFLMGSADDDEYAEKNEKPQHRVTISKAFYLGETPVTQAQYRAISGRSPSLHKGDSNPVEQVSWHDAKKYCERLSSRTGRSVRLPTEAEWEYACRAGTTTRYSFGDDDWDLDEYAWFSGNTPALKRVQPVKRKKPNPWVLYDMHGNVAEWCSDLCDSLPISPYSKAATIDPQGPASGEYAISRGKDTWATPESCRSAYRRYGKLHFRGSCIGFRVVVDLE